MSGDGNRADKVREVTSRACADQGCRSLSEVWLLLRVAGSRQRVLR